MVSRTRLIRPGFFKNEELAEMPFEYRILFAGLWCLADKAGRLEDRPRRIKAEVFPYDAVNVNEGLNALYKRGFIHRYEVEGQAYIQIVAWARNQSPHNTETASVIPPSPFVTHALDNGYVTVTERLDNDAKEDTSKQIPEVGTKGREETRATKAARPSSIQTSYPDTFEVTEEMRSKVRAKYPDLDIDAATEEWAGAMQSNRTKYRYTDWPQAWYGAMRRANEWGTSAKGSKTNGQPTSNKAAAAALRNFQRAGATLGFMDEPDKRLLPDQNADPPGRY